MPDSLPSASEEPLGPSHSMIFPDKDSHLIDSGTTIRQPQDVVTDTSDTNTEPLETNSRIEDLDLRSHLSDLGISVHSRAMNLTQIKYRWFFLRGNNAPLDNPCDIRGMGRLQRAFQLFDIFAHAYYLASGHSSNEPTTQLWVWSQLRSSGSSASDSETFSWSPVIGGYVCPGPGGLQGRYLVIRGQSKPAWVSGATYHRRYSREAHPSSTSNPTSGGGQDI